jgi:transaldolase
MNRNLRAVTEAGVSIWLDDLSRDRLTTGSLGRLIRDDRVSGVTTNPTIFAKAITGGSAYDGQLADLAVRRVEVGEAVRALTTFDVRAACDVLREVYDRTGGVDGRVSIEVDPRNGEDTAAMIAEARALWWMVDRPNAYIKIPATSAGLPAISACLAEGISVNVTLIFSLRRYGEVQEAFLTGLEAAAAAGLDLRPITSVASLFVSRMDAEVDRRLRALATPEAEGLLGRAAMANTRLAYRMHRRSLTGPRWQALAAAGASPQRPLWASTSVKDPAYSDTRYVVGLAVPGVVNTMPEATLRAVAHHGVLPADPLPDYEGAEEVLRRLSRLGIDYDDVVETLEREGLAAFEESWTKLYGELGTRLRSTRARDLSPVAS